MAVDETTGTREVPVTDRVRGFTAHPGRKLLIGLAVLLAVYYLAYLVIGSSFTSTDITVSDAGLSDVDDRVNLSMRVVNVDPSSRTLEALVTPEPLGDYAGENAGELDVPLRMEIIGVGQPPAVTTFAAESIVDSVSVQLPLLGGATNYPFDRPDADFRVSLTDDDSGDAVATSITVINASAPWQMDATAAPNADDPEQVDATIQPRRDYLTTSLVLLTLLAIVLTTVIAVANIGSSIVRGRVEFSQVIWLSATLIAFPSLRSSMPGVPPLGVRMDFLIVFPCILIIAIALVWTAVLVAYQQRPTAVIREQKAGGG